MEEALIEHMVQGSGLGCLAVKELLIEGFHILDRTWPTER